MESLFLANLGSPPLLFFFLGVAAAFVRSDLEIPTQVAKFLSVYLLFAIGFKGGVALAESPLDASVGLGLFAAIGLAAAVPVYVFFLLRRRLSAADAAAISATYGSVSAVTFVTAAAYLDSVGVAWGGHLVAAMALMESPAIIIGILLYRVFGQQAADGRVEALDWGELLRESCLNGSVFLIVGSMLIGWITGSRGMEQIAPFVVEPFIGILCLFLLDMGLVAAHRIMDLSKAREGVIPWPTLVGFALILPLVNAVAGGSIALLLSMPEGDALLLTVLAASASYIAVPAAMRLALPEANPSLYLPMALAVTFPFNLLVGIPAYHLALRLIIGSGT